ncbi:MAG: leucine--tRNA ligase [Fusobacteria bacterium]|nr:leucine--tRNA ligase [Fusobacteriota bacterium]
MEKFDFINSEIFFREKWKNNNAFKQYTAVAGKENYYVLEMLPYPSGKLHMGHVRNYTIGDVVARYKTMNHFNVLHPMGWDSFGLPAENAAIQNGSHPAVWTFANIENMKRQLNLLGFSYDWEREIATCTPEYYRWNQWLFIKMFEKGLAYKKKASVNWCPHDKTVLANEQVENGCCWRCGTNVIQKDLEQWFFKITDYSEELLQDLSLLEGGWPDKVLAMQKNWIGKSQGTQVDFTLEGSDSKIPVFTTRPDTLYGVTYVVLAPEHPLVSHILSINPSIKAGVETMKSEDRFERSSEFSEKHGLYTGQNVINPINGESVPLWIGNYVLMDYGTGAVMAVPAHDTRDFQFAKKYSLEIKVVIQNSNNSLCATSMETAYTEEGTLVNSAQFSGLQNRESIEKFTLHLSEIRAGDFTTKYKLRDWLVSRQRYWGTPIPFVYCENCGMVAEKLENLPIALPQDIEFTENGNPLSTSESFMNCSCPKCGKSAKRETDTMDTFVDSSWYYFRYITPHEDNAMFGDSVNKWMPVNQYIGGVEHAVLHLLYARFFTKVLRDIGMVTHAEPFTNLLTQGMVLSNSYFCPDCKLYFNLTELNERKTCPKCNLPLTVKMEKMSKSKNNGIDPERIISEFGADAARLFILFAAPPERELEWSENGLMGASRFLSKYWNFIQENLNVYQNIDFISVETLSSSGKDLLKNLHKTIKKVTRSIEDNFHFNTAIACVMEYLNLVSSLKSSLSTEEDKKLIFHIMKNLTLLLQPFVPFITAKIFIDLGYTQDIHTIDWPKYKESLTVDNIVKMGVQVNGKLRGELEIAADASEEVIKSEALKIDKVGKYLENVEIIKIIIIKKRIVNIVIK